MAIGGILNQEVDTADFATKGELKQEIDKVNQSLGTLPCVPKLVGSWDYTFTTASEGFDIFSKISKSTLINCRSFYIVSEFTGNAKLTAGQNESMGIGFYQSGSNLNTDYLIAYFIVNKQSKNFSKEELDRRFGSKIFTQFTNAGRQFKNENYNYFPVDYLYSINGSTITLFSNDNLNYLSNYTIYFWASTGVSRQNNIPMRFSVYVIE